MKDWTGNNNLYACNHRTKDSMVAAYDLYCTHPDSVKLFLNKAKERNLYIPKQIWEPAAGLNSITNVLEEHGYDVLATDLVDRGLNQENLDFLQQTKESVQIYKPYLKCIFTNPPYAFAKEFVEKSLELLDTDGICIMFLKLTFLESKKRYSLFQNHKLKYIYGFIQNDRVVERIRHHLKMGELPLMLCLFGIIHTMVYQKLIGFDK